VQCRETLCKVEIRWAADRLQPYVAALREAGLKGHGNPPDQPNFEFPVAVSPVGPAGPDGTRPVEVFLQRKPAG
jgi:hypothetical protein